MKRNPQKEVSRLLRLVRVCKRLFNNWLSAGLRYFILTKLLKKKFYNLHVVCRDGSEFFVSPKVFSYIINGYYGGFFIGVSCREGKVLSENLQITFHEIENSDLRPKDLIFAKKAGWRFDENCNCWEKDKIKFKYMHGTILGVFEHEEYSLIDVNGKTVVDIGAACGDSTIYLLLRGAKNVIAIEPCPELFKELLENLRLNGVFDKVISINVAIGSRGGATIIECPSGRTAVDVLRLEDIVRRFNINGGVLKIDCEGCEYDIVLNEYNYVKLFDEVYFEYHSYITKIPIDVLLEKLSKDFVCNVVSNERFYKIFNYKYNEKQLGLIKCIKRG
jgi:FkbM family methyltransferase